MLAAAAVSARSAQADELRPGYLELGEQHAGDWRIAWKLPLAQPPTGDIALPELPRKLPLFRGDNDRASSAEPFSVMRPCAAKAVWLAKRLGVPALAGPGDMLVRIAPMGQPIQLHRLTAAQPIATITGRASTWQVLGSYFWIGVDHILTGWDHLLFVIALVLLLRRPRAVVMAATAFTLAHSLTLAARGAGFPVHAAATGGGADRAVHRVSGRRNRATSRVTHPA